MNANGMDLSGVIQAASAKSAGQDAVQNSGTEQIIDVPSLVLDVTDATFEQVMVLSQTVPIVVDLWAEWCQPCKTLGPILETVTKSFGGQVILAKVDVDSNPGLAQAFKAQSIPTVAALVQGQAVPLFQGAIPEAQVREYFEKLIEVAKQNGVTGIAQAPDQDSAPEQPAEEQINPLHENALDALEKGDYKTAVVEYERVITNNPKDDIAVAQLSRAKLLDRLTGADAGSVREAAAANPSDLEAQLLVADLDVSGGHVEDAFLRILDLFAAASPDDKTKLRERLLELFEVVGHADPRVSAARVRLANLLF
ncbi:MAG TPA: tetratricopeptide repeat protein [Microbacteriaceae bacterium]|nr:tetratricopeptide repeat protein [Microbacteriaceae bacterium]